MVTMTRKIKSVGRIDISTLDELPKDHEYSTVKFLSTLGHDIVFLKPNRVAGSKTPDIVMDNLKWEIKCPRGSGKYTIEHSFKAAVKQSENIIFDIRSMKTPQDKCLAKIKKNFDVSKSAKRLLIITKSHKLLDFYK
jgi:hypothetical protein